MKKLTTPFAILILTVVIPGCNSASNKFTEDKSVDTMVQPVTSDTSTTVQTEIDSKSNFGGHPVSFYLGHREIPQVCKDLYTQKRPPSDDSDLLALLDSIFTSNNETRPFYFLTLTSTMGKADGAYAEPLGIMCKKFVETRTNEFIDYFINELLLTQGDFDKWAKSVAGELQISSARADKEEVNILKNKMTSNCLACDERRIQKIEEFISRMNYHTP
jgi:hypothetical protein